MYIYIIYIHVYIYNLYIYYYNSTDTQFFSYKHMKYFLILCNEQRLSL